jgi:TP901 family phage tail tape measure protein
MNAAELMVKVGADVDGAINGLNRVDGKVSGFSTAAKAGMLAAGAGIAMGIGAAVHAAADYETSLNTFRAVSGASAQQMSEVSAKAKQLGADITLPGTSAADAATAMTELAKGGLSVKDAMAASKGVLQMSAAAQIDNATAATITAKALNAFGLSGKDATRVADLLAATSNASTAEIGDLALGMQAASSVFKMGRQPIDTLTTALGLMSNAGISGSDAGTSLKTMMMRLVPPTGKAAEALKDMGVHVRDQQGHMLPLRDLIGQFSTATKGMSDAQRDAAFSTIFGSDAIRGANIVLAGGQAAWDKMHDATTKGGEAGKLAAAKMQGFNGSLEAFKSTLETVAITFGSALLPPLTHVMGILNDGLGVVSAHAEAFGYFAAAVAGAAGPLLIAAGAVKALSVATGILTAVMEANPFVLAAAAIIALGVALVYAYKHCEEFRNIVNSAFNAIKGVAQPVVNWLRVQLPQAWETIRSSALRAWPAVVAAVRSAVNAIRSVVQTVVSTVTSLWDRFGSNIMAVARASWQLVVTTVRGYLNALRSIVQAVMAAVHGDWRAAWGHIKDAAVTLLTTAAANIRTILTALVPAVLGLAVKIGAAILHGIGEGLAQLGSWLLGKLTAGISSAIGAVVGMAVSLAASVGRAIADGIVSGVGGLAGALTSKLSGAIHSAIGAVKGMFGIHSPSKHTADHIGKPLAQGILLGLNELDGLGTKLSEKLRAALNRGRDAVRAAQSVVSDAFGQLAEKGLKAFDARTGRMVTDLEKRFAGLQDAVDKGLDVKVKGLEAERDAETPAERALRNLKESRDAEQARTDMEAAEADLRKAQAEADEDAIADARHRIHELELDARQAVLERQAEVERTAAAARFEAAKAAAEAEAQSRKAELDTQLETQRLNLTAQRDLQREHLDEQLKTLETQLENQRITWDQANAKVLAMFKDDFGPKMRTAGANLGKAFAAGLRQQQNAVAAAAEALAKTVSKYLELHSPAEAGPLSSLDTWWSALPATLLGGMDDRQLAQGLAGAVAFPGVGRVPALSGAFAAAGGPAGSSSSSGGGTVWTGDLHVHGSVLSERDLIEAVRTGVIRGGKRNAGGMLGAQA